MPYLNQDIPHFYSPEVESQTIKTVRRGDALEPKLQEQVQPQAKQYKFIHPKSHDNANAQHALESPFKGPANLKSLRNISRNTVNYNQVSPRRINDLSVKNSGGLIHKTTSRFGKNENEKNVKDSGISISHHF